MAQPCNLSLQQGLAAATQDRQLHSCMPCQWGTPVLEKQQRVHTGSTSRWHEHSPAAAAAAAHSYGTACTLLHTAMARYAHCCLQLQHSRACRVRRRCCEPSWGPSTSQGTLAVAVPMHTLAPLFHVPCAPTPPAVALLSPVQHSTAHLSGAPVSAFYHRCRPYRGSDSPLRNRRRLGQKKKP